MPICTEASTKHMYKPQEVYKALLQGQHYTATATNIIPPTPNKAMLKKSSNQSLTLFREKKLFAH